MKQIQGKEDKKMVDIKSEICNRQGHNYVQLGTEKGTAPVLACTKCGDVLKVAA